MLPVMRVFTTRLGESGERHCFHATSARYPPAETKGEGVPLPQGVGVAEGADGREGSGRYLLGLQGETVGDKQLLGEFREEGIEGKIWEHTPSVFMKAGVGIR